MHSDLDQAYRATIYWVGLPHAYVPLRIGRLAPLLDEFVEHLGIKEWAFLTASNPGSELLPPSENRQRLAGLIEAVERAGHAWHPGIGVGESSAEPPWPPEESVLVLDIDHEAAAALGTAFGQKAIVIGRRSHAPELRWLAAAEHGGAGEGGGSVDRPVPAVHGGGPRPAPDPDRAGSPERGYGCVGAKPGYGSLIVSRRGETHR